MKKIIFIIPALALALFVALILALSWLHDFEQLDTTPEQAIAHYKLPESMAHQASSIKRDMDTDTPTILWERPLSGAHDALLKAGWVCPAHKQYYEHGAGAERLKLFLDDKKAVILSIRKL